MKKKSAIEEKCGILLSVRSLQNITQVSLLLKGLNEFEVRGEGCLFTLLIFSFVVRKLLILIRSHLFIFALISRILGGGS